MTENEKIDLLQFSSNKTLHVVPLVPSRYSDEVEIENKAFELDKFNLFIGKVQVFWKGHIILKKSPLCFDVTESKQRGDFSKFCGLLKIS